MLMQSFLLVKKLKIMIGNSLPYIHKNEGYVLHHKI